MKRRKIFAGAALAVLTILVSLSGCQELGDAFPFLSSPTQASLPPTVSNLQSTLFPEITPSPTAETPSGLMLWFPPRFDPDSGSIAGEILKAQLEAFSTEHPGQTIQTRIKAESGTGGLLDTLMAASQAAPSALPDLILLSKPDYEKAVKAGLLVPLETTDLPPDQSDWFPFAKELVTVNSSLYGVPFAGDMLVMGYKRSLIAYPPLDWEGVYEQGAALVFPASDPLGITAMMFYQNAGGTFQYEEDKLRLDESALQKGLQIFYDGASTQIFPFWMLDQKSFEESTLSFLASQAAYQITWSSLYLTNDNESLAIAPIPMLAGKNSTFASGWVLAIPQSSNEQMAASLELVKKLTDPAFQRAWSEAAGYLPMNPLALEGWSDDEESSILMKIAESAQGMPYFEVLEKAGPLFSEATQELVRQQISFIQAANTILTRLAE